MAENEPGFLEKTRLWIRESVTLRLITIGILILLLLIPVSMVQSLISERESRRQEAINEVSSVWGEAQTVTGPVLTVPYKTYSKVVDSKNPASFQLVETKSYAHFLPEKLLINGKVEPQTRKRGLYKVIVYNSVLSLSGMFVKPDFKDWKINESDIIWDEAFISLGLSDLRSIRNQVTMEWGNEKLFFNPGIETREIIASGISAKIKDTSLQSSPDFSFKMDLNLNGSAGLSFIPAGKETNVSLESAWPSPKFDGAYLPETRKVSGSGFTASWSVLHLNRSYPQSFRGSAAGINESAFGVQLYVPVDEYQKSMRSAKYAVMFISLTFLVFFFVQILNKIDIHPLQYLMVGLALCVFYTLLIALSEQLTFGISYVISSIAIISLITLYSRSVFKETRLTMMILFILIILYLFIFTIIQLEDYALLMGSIGLFLVLSLVMYLSRKVDWYHIRR